jgi:hypothetical protein
LTLVARLVALDAKATWRPVSSRAGLLAPGEIAMSPSGPEAREISSVVPASRSRSQTWAKPLPPSSGELLVQAMRRPSPEIAQLKKVVRVPGGWLSCWSASLRFARWATPASRSRT